MTTYRDDAGFSSSTWPTGATGDVTTWTYDDATGLLTSKEDAAGQAVSYTYLEGGKLATRKWARNSGSIVTTYTYGLSTSELTDIDYSDSTPDVHFDYDDLGPPQKCLCHL